MPALGKRPDSVVMPKPSRRSVTVYGNTADKRPCHAAERLAIAAYANSRCEDSAAEGGVRLGFGRECKDEEAVEICKHVQCVCMGMSMRICTCMYACVHSR